MKSLQKLRVLVGAAGLGLLPVGLGACLVASEDNHGHVHDDHEPEITGVVQLPVGTTVAGAAQSSCSTTSVKGLSEQIVAQMNCIIPGSMSEVPTRPNLSFGSATFPFMQHAARDAFVKAVDANPNKSITINSMYRTVAQQYLLYLWGQQKKCGIGLAASPGNSNHETGLALDTSQYSAWQSPLTSNGFKWFGSADAVHFDYVGGGTTNLKGKGVLAFQQLWNHNNPADLISEDGAYGTQTEARLKQAPAAGFPKGATCSQTPEPTEPDGDQDGIPDAQDNCPNVANSDQADADQDGVGDVCDPDRDGDGVPNAEDNCPDASNPDQADSNGNGVGDACDAVEPPKDAGIESDACPWEIDGQCQPDPLGQPEGGHSTSLRSSGAEGGCGVARGQSLNSALLLVLGFMGLGLLRRSSRRRHSVR